MHDSDSAPPPPAGLQSIPIFFGPPAGPGGPTPAEAPC